MLSSTSEKRLAASVAEMSGTAIRLSDLAFDVKGFVGPLAVGLRVTFDTNRT
jgi:hypothetical protein